MEYQCDSVSLILEKELNKRALAANTQFSVEELFEPARVTDWITHLLDCDKFSGLNERISKTAPECLTHAVAAYLLGIAVRERLSLNFDFLPRIFSHGSVGDAFYFFWLVICLCHDLGYQYEDDGRSGCRSYDPSLMETSKGRCTLLNIRHDLFSLEAPELENLGLEPGTEEIWVLESLALAKKYSRMRRKAEEETPSGAMIDHGIAGALILYDALMNEYEHLQRDSGVPAVCGRGAAVEQRVRTGELSSNASRKRFAACAVIIACTVARHNMWTVNTPDAVLRYQTYGLDCLCGSAVRISAEQSMEQLLFLLDFMDTIDPVKNLYTRKAEQHELPDVLKSWQLTLLNSVFIEFQTDSQQFRWEQALKYRTLRIFIDPAETKEKRAGFSDYACSIAGMNKWLKTRPPVLSAGNDGLTNSVTCFYPSFPCQDRVWPGNVQAYEVTSLCLYAGSGSNKAGFFYQCHNAYQTINLLMMDGLEGEQARICREQQRPYGLYIKEWQSTLEVMADIFTAQCKYADHQTPPGVGGELKRVDRRVNLELMKAAGRTFAFTSTSAAEFLPEIAQTKSELVLLDVILSERVPFVDFAGLLQKDYVYSNEQEILLPPFLKVESITEVPLSNDERQCFLNAGGEDVPKYAVRLGKFSMNKPPDDELELVACLEKNKAAASQALEKMCETRVLPADGTVRSSYLAWKAAFQALVRQCFFSIGKKYGWTS